jgi:hypothetical protein
MKTPTPHRGAVLVGLRRGLLCASPCCSKLRGEVVALGLKARDGVRARARLEAPIVCRVLRRRELSLQPCNAIALKAQVFLQLHTEEGVMHESPKTWSIAHHGMHVQAASTKEHLRHTRCSGARAGELVLEAARELDLGGKLARNVFVKAVQLAHLLRSRRRVRARCT